MKGKRLQPGAKKGAAPKKPPETKCAVVKIKSKPKPLLKWQIGSYERHAEFKFIIPNQFLLLCKLLDITPREVLLDFMDAVAHGTWKREGREERRAKAMEYFISCGYGQSFYGEEERRTMFAELDALALLWPTNGKGKLIDLYAKWRDKYQLYWFKKWFRKHRRKL